MTFLGVNDWVELPRGTPEEVQRVGKVVSVEYVTTGPLKLPSVWKFAVFWEPVDLPGGQAIIGNYSVDALKSGFVRPLGLLDRLVRET